MALPAGAQQMDTQAMQRWGAAKVVYYTVEGIHSGPASVTAHRRAVVLCRQEIHDRQGRQLDLDLHARCDAAAQIADPGAVTQTAR